MSINDGTFGDFANELQDEDQLDAHPVPGIEIGYDIQRDCGSGSYAEDGPREVREDRPIMNGENMLGSAAMYGPTEIGDLEDEDAVGAVKKAVARAAQAVKKAVIAKKTASPQVAAKHAAVAKRAVADAEHAFASAPYAQGGAVEIGEGWAAAEGASEIGDELGYAPYADEGAVEIGAGEDTLGTDSLTQPFESFMMSPDRLGCEDEIGSAAMYGPTEIGSLEDEDAMGAVKKAVAKAAQAVKKAVVAKKTAPPRVAAQHAAVAKRAVADAEHAFASAPYAQGGAVEIGEGWAAAEGASEIGYDDDDEVGGPYAADGAVEIGDDEIGAMYPTNGLSEMGDDELGEGWAAAEGASEIGAGLYPVDGASEIGEEATKAAVVKVVEKARNNRQPAPPMKAVDVDAPLEEDEDDFLSGIVIGATVAAPGAVEPFPLLSQLLLRAGANVEPRIVRVDTEESYKQFRTAQSPALSEVKALSDRLEAHIVDPNAHELDSEDIDDDINDLVMLGEEAKAVEAQKRVEMWMPRRFDGKVEAWRHGDMVCVSLAIPGRDGCVRICTSFDPVQKGIEEISRHASETRDGEAIVGVLPAMGCVLGAGTVMKEIAAAAPAILARPEAQMKLPFVVRIEPKTSPNLAALVMLAATAKMGNAQAASEWQKLASLSAPTVKLAMLEAAEVAKAATGV